MKAKLKDGRVLPIEDGSLIALDNNGDTLEVNVENIDCFIDNNIDWKQIRIQAAISAMQGMMSAISKDRFTLRIKEYVVAKASIEYADALIEELKKTM